MPKEQKNVSINIFHILKGVMDSKAQKLQATVRAADDAAHEKELMSKHIAHLQMYAACNRSSDPHESYDAEALVESYEYQMKGIGKKIERGNAARAQLKFVKKFNETYSFACGVVATKKKLEQLMAERSSLESRLSMVEKNIEACEINMTPNTYNGDVTEQASHDISGYMEEYERLSRYLRQVNEEIADIRTK